MLTARSRHGQQGVNLLRGSASTWFAADEIGEHQVG
jgi:hypothetical protein